MNHSDEKPLTFDELLSRCMGELDFARKILRDFVDSSDSAFDGIESSIKNGSRDEIVARVHRLKGTAATLAAKPLFHSLVEIEELFQAGQQPNKEEVTRMLNASRHQFERVREYADTQLL